MATTVDGARSLHVSNGCVELGERQEFGTLMRALNYDFQQMEARLAESRASKGEGAVIEDERRAARMHETSLSLGPQDPSSRPRGDQT